MTSKRRKRIKEEKQETYKNEYAWQLLNVKLLINVRPLIKITNGIYLFFIEENSKEKVLGKIKRERKEQGKILCFISQEK